jgi:CheY-like chemotaxis protein
MSNIVHTDNSEFFRKIMKTFLAELGHTHEEFARGEDALELIKTGKVDCVITGMELADMHGEEFIKRLAVSRQTIPVFVVTSRDNDDQLKRLKILGVRAIMHKSGNWKNELGVWLANIK